MPTDSGGVGPFTDYYDLLGVDQTADRATIMRAYREQVKRYHPDVASRRADGSSQDAETAAYRFKHLSNARAILSNPARREEYDRLGHATYLTHHADSDPIQTGGTQQSSPASDATASATPMWYDENNRSAEPSPVGNAGNTLTSTGAVDAGSVIEGDDETTIGDLVESDPLEVTWTWFRHCWLARSIALVVLLALGVTMGDTTVAGVGFSPGLTLGILLAVVVLTGAVARLQTPDVDSDPTPPPSASVGLLRPAVIARYRQRSWVLLSVIVALVVTGSVNGSNPWTIFSQETTSGGIWLSAGLLGAPKLERLLETGLGFLFVAVLAVGLLCVLFTVSASGWLAAQRSDSGWWHPLWDALPVTGSVCVVVAFTAPTSPIAGSLFTAVQRALGGIAIVPTGYVLGIAGLLSLVLLLVLSTRRHQVTE